MVSLKTKTECSTPSVVENLCVRRIGFSNCRDFRQRYKPRSKSPHLARRPRRHESPNDITRPFNPAASVLLKTRIRKYRRPCKADPPFLELRSVLVRAANSEPPRRLPLCRRPNPE